MLGERLVSRSSSPCSSAGVSTGREGSLLTDSGLEFCDGGARVLLLWLFGLVVLVHALDAARVAFRIGLCACQEPEAAHTARAVWARGVALDPPAPAGQAGLVAVQLVGGAVELARRLARGVVCPRRRVGRRGSRGCGRAHRDGGDGGGGGRTIDRDGKRGGGGGGGGGVGGCRVAYRRHFFFLDTITKKEAASARRRGKECGCIDVKQETVVCCSISAKAR
jgi:hypothetical protein